MPTELTPAQRAHLASIGRLGGLTAAATRDAPRQLAGARAVLLDSFRDGHGCRLCPMIEIPKDLPERERQRRTGALRKLHYARMARARWTKKGGKHRRT